MKLSLKGKIAILLALSLLVGASVFVSNTSTAQETSATKPTPTPTPEVIEEDDEPLKIDTEVVNVLFSAQDKSRRLLTTLKQEDVRILENGQAQEIIEFRRQVDLPLSLAILIDTSPSQERTLPELKESAKSFLDAVVRPAQDEVAILTFTGETTLEQGLTNNLQRLRRAVDRVEFIPPSGYIGGGVVVPGTPPISGDNQRIYGTTALWDAVFVTSEDVLMGSPQKTRRAMILLTDGVNWGGQKKYEEALQAALRAEVVIYSIGIGDYNNFTGVDKPALTKISERTGGTAFFPRDEAELRKAWVQIQIDMRSQYLIAYAPVNQKRDGSYRTIDIQLTNSEYSKQKITLTHRKGYFAKKDKPETKK